MPYTTQAAMEQRISVKTLAELTNDNANLYVFTVSGITVTPTAGAVYTNNGQTFTVISASITTGAGTVTFTYTGIPSSSGTLTKSSGTGDSTITFSAATAADATVVTALILRADTFLDEELHDVYTVPFSPVPNLIAQYSCDLACYYAMQRRPVQFEITDDWNAIYDRIIANIEKLKTLEDVLEGLDVNTSGGEMVPPTTDPIVDFNNANNVMSTY